MRMRRVNILLLISVLLSATVFCGTAYAADDGVTVSGASVTPASLPGDGQVQVTVNVAVSMSRASGISGAFIDGPGVDTASETKQDIQVGDNRNLSCTLHVSPIQLGLPIQLSVKWDDEITGNSFSVTVASQNQVVFTRTISPDKPMVAKGDTVTVTYTVQNAGSADITNVNVADDGMPNMPQRADTIAAGQSRDFKISFPMSADFTTAPKLTYKLGADSHTMTCTAKTVAVKIVQLDATLSAVPSAAQTGGDVLLVCDLKNSGNVKLTNVVISDGAGNNYYSLSSLEKGGVYTYTRKITLTQTAQFQLTVTAKDDTGAFATFKTNELQVKVTSGGGQYNVTVTADADALQLAEPGPVNFSIDITNNGTNAISNAYLTDQNGKTISTFPSLPPGDTQYTYTDTVNGTAQYKFTLVIPGDNGDFKADSGTVEVRIAAPEASASATPSATATDSQNASVVPASSNLDWLVKILLVIVVLIVITVIVMIAISVSEKRRGMRKR